MRLFVRGMIVAVEPRRRAITIQAGKHKGIYETTTVTVDRDAWANIRTNLDSLLGGSVTLSGGRLLTKRGSWPVEAYLWT